MKEYIEERAIQIANYIIDENATVRQTAKRFGISKSTVHKDVTKRNGSCGSSNRHKIRLFKNLWYASNDQTIFNGRQVRKLPTYVRVNKGVGDFYIQLILI